MHFNDFEGVDCRWRLRTGRMIGISGAHDMLAVRQTAPDHSRFENMGDRHSFIEVYLLTVYQ